MKDLSTEELIQAALTTQIEDNYWDIISILHHRGSYEVFLAAKKLCESSIIQERQLGVNILGQLGVPERSFPEQTFTLLMQILAKDTDPNIISAVGFALGHLQDLRRIEPLVKFKNHPSADVRLSVVFGLLNLENDLAINTLIELSSDVDAHVRNWATFGLGNIIVTDNDSVRDALWQRLINENDNSDIAREIREEALLGLAKSKDERIVNILITELSSRHVSSLVVEAAQELGDVRLCPQLLNLSQWWQLDVNLLAEAIHSCQTKN